MNQETKIAHLVKAIKDLKEEIELDELLCRYPIITKDNKARLILLEAKLAEISDN